MPAAPPVLLFDGVCNLCNWLVQFIVRHDPQARLRFAALQSEASCALLATHGLLAADAAADPDSVVLIENDQAYLRSAAVLRVLRHLGWPWRAATIGYLLPRTWRDVLYRYVARHRYRWFGRQQACLMPTPELQARFLK